MTLQMRSENEKRQKKGTKTQDENKAKHIKNPQTKKRVRSRTVKISQNWSKLVVLMFWRTLSSASWAAASGRMLMMITQAATGSREERDPIINKDDS